jgi:two-component system, NtrC family, sensor histidine kinase HydH
VAETLFEELKRYVGFGPDDEAALRGLHAIVAPDFERIASLFYQRILEHDQARKALEGGESQVGRLKVTLVGWMDKLLHGPWDEDYYQLRCRIGRVHVRISLPQHYMFGAMNVLRQELNSRVDASFLHDPARLARTRAALSKMLDLELAIMLHTFREDLLAREARHERLVTFGQLVGSLGHELRNPLGVIESSLFILKGRVGEDERVQKHVNRIGEQLGIANTIISDLLDMIRDKPLTRESLALGEVVQAACELVSHRPEVTLTTRGLEALRKVEGDAGQLRQVFVNLVTNSVQAVGPSGTIEVIGRRTDAAVEVAVEDSGPGIDADTRRRLFEPLVTTKAKGVGLGLALVKRIVERHGGTIRYEPREGLGARFVVRLPGS